MADILLPNDSTTITLNGTVLRNLAEGDQTVLTFPNARTGRVNSETGVTIHERSDADVCDIAVNVQALSDDDVLLSGFMQSKPLTVIEGSVKRVYHKNGEKMMQTYSIQAASITDQPAETVNSQDGSAVMSYTIQSRRTVRSM